MLRQYTEIFRDLEEDHEKVVRITRRHWFDILQQFAPVVGLSILLTAAAYSISASLADGETVSSGEIFIFLTTFMLVFFWIYSFFVWINYYFDVWIIADGRIINVEQVSIFSRRVAEFKYDRIQDVTVEVRGIFQTALDFGDVRIQTASQEENFIFRKVPKPYEIKDLIMDLQRKGMKDRFNRFGEMIKEEVGEANDATQKKA